MLRRSLVATMLAVGAAVVVGVAPAQAVTIPPPGGESLIVLNYYRGGELVGQKWWGCPGQPPGQWGVTNTHPTMHTVPC